MTTFKPDAETIATENMSSDALMENLVSEDNRSNYVDMIQAVIASLDSHNTAMVSRAEGGHLWKFRYGSVEVFVQLTGMGDDDLFSIWAAVLNLPVQNEAQLMTKLLEMNWSSTFEACFAITDNQVVVSAIRTLAGLSPSEVSRLITIVATIADDYDDALQAEFPAA